MQHIEDKRNKFNKALGKTLQKMRTENRKVSISRLAREYDIDRGNLSKIERGINSCNITTAWKICEATGIKFSDFAKLLERELGQDFKFVDE